MIPRPGRAEGILKPMIPWFEQPVLDIPLPDGLPFSHIPLHGFGLLVAVGFLLGSKVAMNRARRIGLDPEPINQLVGWLVLGTFVGGHVGYGLMYAPHEYLSDPIKFLHVWEGLSSWGGFFVCVPLAFWFFKKNRLPMWPYMDCLAHGMTIGWFFGRLGCFVAHDHPGPPTEFFLGVYGMCPPGHNQLPDLACHDMGLYESLWSLSMFGLFTLLDRKARTPGFYPLLLGGLYTPIRFMMDFLRPVATDVRYFGLTPAQYACLLFMGLCGLGIYWRSRSGDAPVWAPMGSGTRAATKA